MKGFLNFIQMVHIMHRFTHVQMLYYGMFHRTPTPGDNSGIPPIAPYDRNAPNYLAFRPQGPVIVQNFLGKSGDNFI